MAKNLNITTVKLTLNGKEVEWSLQRIRKEAEKTALKMKGMEAGSKEWKEQFKRLETLHKAEQDLIPTLERVNHYMKEIGKTATTDIGKAIRELTKMRDAMPGDHKDLDKVNRVIEYFKSWQAQNKNLGMSFDKAKKQLNDLVNTPTEKLRQGLKAIEEEAGKVKTEADRAALSMMANKYRAQIAVNEQGRAGSAAILGADRSAAIAMDSKDRQAAIAMMQAEQQRLRAGYMATAGVQGYEAISQEYLERLYQVNQAVANLTETEREFTQTQRQLITEQEKAAQAAEVAGRAFSGDKVKLEELTEAQKTLEAQIRKMEGMGLAPNEETELNRAKMMLDDVNKALDEIAMKDIDFQNLDATPTEKLTAALKNLEEQEKRLSGYQETEAEEIARKKAMIQKQLEKNKLAVMDVARAEQIAADRGRYSVQELKQAYETLQQKLLTLNTSQRRDIARTKEDMAKLKQRIDEVTGAVKTQNTIWQTAVRNITAYVGVFGAFNFIKDKIMQVFESNKQLSDSLANIRKVSGLTGEEINTLYTNIAKIDTRNSVEQLNELAYAGAKLGVQEHGGVAALTGFVRAAEQVQMALGEDLGEDALPAIAKLTEVMGLMDQYGVEQAMQKAASAIFMLSTTSTSTGANIVEFSKRLMGLANVSHVTSAELVALGSASDSMGLMAEVSSTAFNKVFTKIQSNTAAIEQAVGVAKGSLKSLVDEGKTMEAIVTVFDKMRDMSMEEMQRRGIFTALGSDGARLNNVMTTMADRVDMLKKHLDVANKAFEEGEAVIAEYMIQNQTAAAYIERASNAFEKAFTNPEGVDVVTDLAKQWHELATEMTNSTVMMGSMKAALWAILEVVKGLLYVLPFLTQFLLFKGSLALLTQLCVGFWNMSKAIWACVTASKALTLAQKWNGIATGLSLLAATVLTLKAAFDQAGEAAERARQKQQELDKSFAESKDVVDKSTKSLDEYKTALDKSNLSQDERDKRLRAYMNNEYQPYLDFLGLEIDKVEDLADAYAQVTQAIKLKAAAEEKENYRSKVNGENRNNRIAAQAEVIREAKKAGFDIDKSFLDANWEEGSNALYNRITGGGSGAYVEKRKLQFPKFGELSRALKEYQKFKSEETRIDRETERMFNEEYKNLDLEHFSLEEFRKKQMEAQIQREKNRKNTVDMPPTKDELKAQRKAEAEHKQAIRKDLQDAKQESDAIIAKIEEWYRLQETVVTGFAADGKWTQEQAEMVNRELEAAKNEALANARLAISGRDTETWERTKQNLRVMMFDTGEWSQELFQQMMDVSMAAIRQNLSRIDKEGGQYGITTSSLKDGLDKNAAGNRRKVQELRNKTAKEVEKMLKQYDFLQQAMDAFDNRLAQLGLLTDSAVAAANRIRQATENPDEALKAGYQAPPTAEQVQQQRRQGLETAATRFIAGGGKSMAVNYNDSKELNDWLRELTNATVSMGANGMEFKFESWADAFKEDFDKWLHNSEKYKSEIQAFYLSLVQASDDYTEATKKAYEREKKLQDQRFQLAGYRDQEEQTDKSLERQGVLKDAGIGQTIPEQLGLDKIADDPEILRIQNRIHWRKVEYDDAKRNLEAQMELDRLRIEEMQRNGATEQQIEDAKMTLKQQRSGLEELMKERETALINETYNLTSQVAQQMQKRVDSIKNFVKPVTDFTQAAGRKIGDMIFNMQSEEATWEELWKNMALAVGEAVIEMGAQYMQNFIMQQSINRASESEAISDATVKTTAGIAAGSAKTIGELGWWGIPLVAVISALLMGLLQAALSTNRDSGSNANAAKPKVKLASGMLTYDKGNVQQTVGSQWRGKNGEYITDERRTVVGDDGRVYRAREQRSLPEGVSMVTEPIATRVNGQQALVGERGPEIVIGRRTTRAIQMNRPDLLRDLALIDRGITTRKVRTFDEGNLSDLASAIRPTDASTESAASDGSQTIDAATAEALRQMPAAMAAFAQVMTVIQKQGIPSYIKKYGTGGLIDEVQSGLKFVSKYK